jgi:hypothetical protein
MRRTKRDASRGSPGSFVRAKNALSQDDNQLLTWDILFQLEAEVGQAVGAFDLENYWIAGLQGEEG